jgi:hypothetical protein
MDADITEQFRTIDTKSYPDFYCYTSSLEKGLWVLWVAKDELKIKALSAKQIASVITDVKEVKATEMSIARAFAKAGDKLVVIRRKNSPCLYQIMKEGKDFLSSNFSKEEVEVFYFEPENRFSSKRILSKNLLAKIKGDFGIVDPYCGVRTLDILKEIDDRNIKFLTKLDKLRPTQKTRFLRHLTDFKTECTHVEFRDYPSNDIHDRYIVSDDYLVILGHSIKDLGSKETFSIFLNEDMAKDIVQDLRANFNRRWRASTPI